MKFCWNCGFENEENARFCEECGKDLTLETIDRVEERASEDTTQTLVIKAPRKSLSRNQKRGLLAVGIVVAMIFGIYSYGKHYFGYDQQVARIVETIKTKDPEQWSKIMISNDPSYKVTAKSLKKMTDYYKVDAQKENFSALVQSFTSRMYDEVDFSIVQEGKSWFVYDRYVLELKPVYLTIETSQEDVVVEVDGKKEGEESVSITKVGPLTPGNYEIKGTLNDVSTEQVIDLTRFNNIDFEQNSHVTLDLHKLHFMVLSNVEGAEVMVDDKPVAIIKDSVAEVKDVVWHEGLTVRVQKTFDKETMQSIDYEIGASEFIAENYEEGSYYSGMELAVEDVRNDYEASSFLSNFYSEVSNHTNELYTFDEKEKEQFASYFSDGAANLEYQDFMNFITEVRSNKGKRYVNGNPEVESFTLVAKDTYEVQYLIEYRTVFKDYSKDTIEQVFRYKKVTIKYNQETGQFEIVDLGGKENFETIDNGDAV